MLRRRRRVAADQSVEELEYIAKVSFDKAFSFLDTAKDVIAYLDGDLEDLESLKQDPKAISELRELANELNVHLGDAYASSWQGSAALQKARAADEQAQPDEHAAPRLRRRR